MELILIVILQVFGIVATPNSELTTVERYCLYQGEHYVVQYTYDQNKPYFEWGVMHINNPHYDAEIVVYSDFKGRRYYIYHFKGIYVQKGCLEDIPENLVEKAIKRRNKLKRA